MTSQAPDVDVTASAVKPATGAADLEDVEVQLQQAQQQQQLVLDVPVPAYGVKLKFNHVFPEKRMQNLRPTIRQSLPLLPLAFRYVFFCSVVYDL